MLVVDQSCHSAPNGSQWVLHEGSTGRGLLADGTKRLTASSMRQLDGGGHVYHWAQQYEVRTAGGGIAQNCPGWLRQRVALLAVS
jgi:hypothetical protein